MVMWSMDQLLAWCIAHIKCDLCGQEGGCLTKVSEKNMFLCSRDRKFLTRSLRPGAVVEQPPLFPSTSGEEESPENA